MRIVSGAHKGRSIAPPKNFSARPTTDFAKVALFNIISVNFDIEASAVLDLFSGTGGISYEFASRGAKSVDSVELDYHHHAFIKKTAALLDFEQLRCYRQDAFAYLNNGTKTYDLIFADPPYALAGIERIPPLVFGQRRLNPGGWLIFEHAKGKDFSALPYFKQVRRYGSVNFSIFEMPPADPLAHRGRGL
ncbi:MAG: RsmD family RNA methyltransferase [Prevotellaceae bacterium]|jgi:16S rRNA (guanine(966)-N(2))-methyltransferase RsmD|nr:RsmD family RNA methyltransferase [Prevotellaceae bacterium]